MSHLFLNVNAVTSAAVADAMLGLIEKNACRYDIRAITLVVLLTLIGSITRKTAVNRGQTDRISLTHELDLDL